MDGTIKRFGYLKLSKLNFKFDSSYKPSKKTIVLHRRYNEQNE